MAEDTSAEAVPPSYAATALALTVQDWGNLGLEDPEEKYVDMPDGELFESLVERATSMLLVRIVGILVNQEGGTNIFADLSSSTICRTVLVKEKPWKAYAPGISDEFLKELKAYVRTILSGYNDTPYHNNKHAFHVLLSVNKLTDLMLQNSKTKTYGLRKDPLAIFALLFAALIHDVEHRGIPNRQLVIENDPLAVLYNDSSVAEQRSLFIAFEELLKPDYKLLRSTLFQAGDADSVSYGRFRKLVIDVVLHTDIASPERTQIGKSKWKEAFGDTFESMERKLKQQLNEKPIDSESLSETPDSSANEGDDDLFSAGDLSNRSIEHNIPEDEEISVDTMSKKKGETFVHDQGASIDGITPMIVTPPMSRQTHGRPQARSMPMGRRTSLQLLQTDEAEAAKFQRRMSSMETAARRKTAISHRRRLSICRSIDFSGEAIENYKRSTNAAQDLDEPDELKAAVVMETIMTAADVAHNLQGWDQMIIWSGRLYMELRKAFVEGRGGDPENRWFENQIGFLESYLLPLARRLEDTGVFGDYVGQTFATTVEANRDKWMEEGREVTTAIVEHGQEVFNENTLEEEIKRLAEKKNQALGQCDVSAQIKELMTLIQEHHKAGMPAVDQAVAAQLSSLVQVLNGQMSS